MALVEIVNNAVETYTKRADDMDITKLVISQSGVASPYFIGENDFEFSLIPRDTVERILTVNGTRVNGSKMTVSDTILRYLLLAEITVSDTADIESKVDDAALAIPKDADEIIFCSMKIRDATEISLKSKSIETFLSRKPNANLWQILMINQDAKVLLTEMSVSRVEVPDIIRDPTNFLRMKLGGYLIRDGQLLIAGSMVFVTQYFTSKPKVLQTINKTVIDTIISSIETGVPFTTAEALSSNPG